VTLIIPPGFANAAFTFTSDTGTQPFVTTLGVDVSAFGGDFVEAANVAMTYYGQNMAANTDSALTLDRVTLSVGSDGPGGSVDSDLPPIPMTRSASGAPMAMAAIARKVTNELGRRGRGRMFLPGTVSNSDADESGQLSPTRITSLNTALDNLWDDFANGSSPLLALPPVLLHSTTPVDPTPITSLGTALLVGWIRGRIR
jgi:hypothetical protein